MKNSNLAPILPFRRGCGINRGHACNPFINTHTSCYANEVRAVNSANNGKQWEKNGGKMAAKKNLKILRIFCNFGSFEEFWGFLRNFRKKCRKFEKNAGNSKKFPRICSKNFKFQKIAGKKFKKKKKQEIKKKNLKKILLTRRATKKGKKKKTVKLSINLDCPLFWKTIILKNWKMVERPKKQEKALLCIVARLQLANNAIQSIQIDFPFKFPFTDIYAISKDFQSSFAFWTMGTRTTNNGNDYFRFIYREKKTISNIFASIFRETVRLMQRRAVDNFLQKFKLRKNFFFENLI